MTILPPKIIILSNRKAVYSLGLALYGIIDKYSRCRLSSPDEKSEEDFIV